MGLGLAHGGRYKEAVEVVGAGLELAPRHARLLHNRKAVWTQWRWACWATGKRARLWTCCAGPPRRCPTGTSPPCRRGCSSARARRWPRRKWDKALAALDVPKDRIDRSAADEVSRYRSGLRLRRAHAEIAEGRFSEAIDVLAAGLESEPNDKRLPAHLAFAVQEDAAATHGRDGDRRAREVLAAHRETLRERAGGAGRGRGLRVVRRQGVDQGRRVREGDRLHQGLRRPDRRPGDRPPPDPGRPRRLGRQPGSIEDSRQLREESLAVYRDAGKHSPNDPELPRRAASRLEDWTRARPRRSRGRGTTPWPCTTNTARVCSARSRPTSGSCTWPSSGRGRPTRRRGALAADKLSAPGEALPEPPSSAARDRPRALAEVVRELTRAGKYEQALAVLDRAGPVLDDATEGASSSSPCSAR